MRIILLVFCYLMFVIKGVYSQPLNISQTIEYLNQFSTDHTGLWNFEDGGVAILLSGDGCENRVSYSLNYDNTKGFLLISENKTRINCKSGNKQIYPKREFQYWINLRKIDLNDIRLIYDDNTYAGITIESSMQKSEYDTIKKRFSTSGVLVNWVHLSVQHNKYAKVFYNGLKYLITIAKNQVKEFDNENIEDPFPKSTLNIGIHSNSKSNIPLYYENGVYKVFGKINLLRETKFILDSGASDCSISENLESVLLKFGIINRKDYITNGLYRLADGSIVENRRVLLKSLKIGQFNITNVIVSIGGKQSPNLLGQSFLKKLGKWSIDNDKNQLIIENN